MKKLIALSFLVCMVAMTANTGCTSPGSSTNPLTVLPDIANFEIQAATAFIKGAASTISILAPSLGNGAFTINYNLTGNNTLTNQTAALNVSGGSGTFQTPALANGGQTNITINSITNSAGGSATVTSNNTYTFSDSTGLMTGTYTVGATNTALRATDVYAQLTGPLLTIYGVIWEPNLTNITISDAVYSGAISTVSFNFNNSTALNGNAGFQVTPTTGSLINETDAHGTLTISAISPLLTGNFSYTNTDSSTVICTFSCPYP